MSRVVKKNVYRVVNRALRDAKAKGVKVVDQCWSLAYEIGNPSGRFGLENGCGCPMACLLAGKKVGKSNSPVAAAAKVLSKPKMWVESFITGFDGSEFVLSEGHKDAYNFGKRLRTKHIEASV